MLSLFRPSFEVVREERILDKGFYFDNSISIFEIKSSAGPIISRTFSFLKSI